MRTVSFLRLFVYIFVMFFVSCSDPIFWVTSREEVVSKNNLPKDTQATGIVVMNNHYYATVGSSLWKRPTAGGQWQRITLPSRIANGVGVTTGGTLYVGTYNGVYQSTDGINFTKVSGSGNAAVYQVGNDVYFAMRKATLGQLDITKNTFSATAQYTIVGAFMGAGSQGVAGNNGIYNGTSGIPVTNGRFSWLSGYNQNYLYADGIVGEWNGNWVKSAGTGHASSRGSAIFQLGNTWAPVKALFSVYGLGYFELYEDGANLKVRPPTSTVSNKDAYSVSDLAFSTITGFYEHNGTIFALTSRKGLWRLSSGTWSQE